MELYFIHAFFVLQRIFPSEFFRNVPMAISNLLCVSSPLKIRFLRNLRWRDTDKTGKVSFIACLHSNSVWFYDCLKLAQKRHRMGIFSSSSETCVLIFKHFLVVTDQWPSLNCFLSSIPPDVFGFVLKFQIFFVKTCTFRVRDLQHFCYQYSSFLPTFNYLRVATGQWNLLHGFLSLIPVTIFGIILNSKYSKNLLFKKNVRHMYSFIVESLEYFLVAVPLLNLVHSFLLSMSTNVLEIIFKI